jgi:hypothetical protein
MLDDDPSLSSSAAVPFPTLTILYLPAEAKTVVEEMGQKYPNSTVEHWFFPRGAEALQKGNDLEPGHRQPMAQCSSSKGKRACRRGICDACFRRHNVSAIGVNRLRIISLVIDTDAMSKYTHSLSAIAQGFAFTSLALMFSASTLLSIHLS